MNISITNIMESLEDLADKHFPEPKRTYKRKCDGGLFCECFQCNPSRSRRIKQVNDMHRFMKGEK